MTSPIAAPWGLILIGVFISLVLYGIIVAQVFTYYQDSEKDPLWQKVFIGILFLLDTLSSALAMAWMYQLLIDNWGNIVAFESGEWLLGSDPMVAGVVAFMVQLFFAWRIHIVAGQPLLTMGIIVCSFVTLCGGIGTGIAVLWVKNYALFANFRPIAIVWLISATVGDISITVALTYHLRRRKGSFPATDRVLDRIVQMTIQNGLLTSLVSIVDMTLYLSTPIPYHIALSFLMPKLYVNTVLSSLNARRSLRPLGKITESGLGSESTTRAPDVVMLSRDVRRPEVLVSTEVHELTDAKSEWK